MQSIIYTSLAGMGLELFTLRWWDAHGCRQRRDTGSWTPSSVTGTWHYLLYAATPHRYFLAQQFVILKFRLLSPFPFDKNPEPWRGPYQSPNTHGRKSRELFNNGIPGARKGIDKA
jgi:hypothetical protein